MTPLEYSIDRNSNECAQILLYYIIQHENIFSAITQQEIVKLITFSPNNLFHFFNEGIMEQDLNVPAFGNVLKEPYTYVMSDNTVMSRALANSMLTNFDEEGSLPITFKNTKFVYNFEPGSKHSIDFH
jgi:hypothetical protein